MGIEIAIKVNAKDAVDGAAALEKGLGAAAKAGDQARDSMGRFAREGSTSMNQVSASVEQGRDSLGRFQSTGSTSMSTFGNAVDGVSSQVHELVEVLALVEAFHVGEELIDGYTEISNRLRSVSKDQENLNGLMQATLGIAQDTRTSWDDTAATYQRLSSATKGLGISQRQVLDLQSEITMGMRVAGATAQEASMSTRELMHAFETGSLTMREFKVLQRDAPGLMRELGDASGYTGAQMAQMAHSGQLTGEKLIEMFSKAGPAIQEKFGAIIPTIKDNLIVLKNAAENFFGESATGAGIMRVLGDATQFIVAHFETFAKIILGVGEALLGLYVIDKIIGLVKALSAAIAANPLGALLTAIVVGISLLRQFGDEWTTGETVMSKAGKTAVTVGDYLGALWDMIKKLAITIKDFVSDAWHRLTSAFSTGLDGTGIELTLKNVLVFVASFVDVVIGLFRGLYQTGLEMAGGAVVAVGEAAINIAHGVAKGFESVINTILEAIEKLLAKVVDLGHTKFGQLAGLGPMAQLADQLGGSKALEGSLGRVDLSSWKNPLDGAFDALKKVSGEFVDIVKNEDSAKKAATGFADALQAAAEASARARQPKAGATISDQTGDKEAHVPTDKELEAWKKLQDELRAITEQSNPMVEALTKLAHANDILDQAVGVHMITQLQANKIYEDMTKKLEPAIHPFDEMVRKTIEMTAALRDNAEEQALSSELTKQLDDLRKKGMNEITEPQIDQMKRLNKLRFDHQQLMTAEQGLTNTILGPQKQYAIGLEAAGDLLEKGKIDAAQYNTEVDKLRATFLDASGASKTMTGGLESGWLAIKAQIQDIGSSVKKALVDAFNSVNEALTDLITTGTTDWKKMAQSMERDLVGIGLKNLEGGLLNALTGQASAAETGTTTGATASATMLAAAPGIGLAIGAAAAGAMAVGGGIGDGTSAITDALKDAGLPGFATGGSFIVGGDGGRDTTPVGFMGTRGERVTIERNGGGSSGGGSQQGPAPSVRIVNVSNQREQTLASLNTRAGEKLIVNGVLKNSRMLGGHIVR